MSIFRHDGGCYILSRDTYRQFLSCTHRRYHLIEELHLLLVQTEAELHHIVRLIEDNLPAFYQHGDHDPLHRSLTDLLQDFRALRRHYYKTMLEQNSCPELQSIYQRRLSSRTWTPHHLPTRTRSCPTLQPQRYAFRTMLPFDYVQLRRGFSPMFEPESWCTLVTLK